MDLIIIVRDWFMNGDNVSTVLGACVLVFLASIAINLVFGVMFLDPAKFAKLPEEQPTPKIVWIGLASSTLVGCTVLTLHILVLDSSVFGIVKVLIIDFMVVGSISAATLASRRAYRRSYLKLKKLLAEMEEEKK